MSRTHGVLPVATLAAVALVVAALSGCAPATKHVPTAGHSSSGGSGSSPSASASPIASPTPTPTPTPTFPPALPANALFQISAVVTAPGGASANLVQTVFLPTAITAAQRTQFNTVCKGETDTEATGAPWLNNYAHADVLASTMTATMNPGSPAWSNSTNPVLSDFMAFGAFSGAYRTFEAYCAPGTIQIPGTEQAIAPIQPTNPSGQLYGWAGEFSAYGFFGGGNSTSDADLGGKAVVSNCHVQLSSTASASTVAAGWAAKMMGLHDGCDYTGPAAP